MNTPQQARVRESMDGFEARQKARAEKRKADRRKIRAARLRDPQLAALLERLSQEIRRA